MASPNSQPSSDFDDTTIHDTLVPPATAPSAVSHVLENGYEGDEYPVSPETIAAAVTLATLSDSRPPTSHSQQHDENMLEDDDQGGGISLMESLMEGSEPIGEGEVGLSMAPVELFYSGGFSGFSATWTVPNPPPPQAPTQQTSMTVQSAMPSPLPPPLGNASSVAWFDVGNMSISTMNVGPGPTYTYSATTSPAINSLEPPPFLHETHLNIPDNGSFMPISTFFHHISSSGPTVPGLDLVKIPHSITRDHLRGNHYDFQGIDWEIRKTTRAAVRSKRVAHQADLVQGAIRPTSRTPRKDNFFQFRRYNTKHRALFPHFQLRNVLAATSRNDIFYASGHKLLRTDAEGTTAEVITDLGRRLSPEGTITTISAANDILIAGAFDGEYAITNLASEFGAPCTFGRTTDGAANVKSRIVNHIHLFGSRSTYSPQAVLCSNDNRLRVLDITTDTFTHSFDSPAAVNCSATSPDGRMRVVVGDFQEVLITNAETGQPFERLKAHTDDAFACAWADNGIHVATAAQDYRIAIWDARNWARPLEIQRSELSIPRSLRFSPVGSGPRVLIAAEADDYVNIINAQTFQTKQVFDFFGPIGGTAFSPDGQSLFIANGERRFGGILELERTGWAEQTSLSSRSSHEELDFHTYSPQREKWLAEDVENTDMAHDDYLDTDLRIYSTEVERNRRAVDFSDLII